MLGIFHTLYMLFLQDFGELMKDCRLAPVAESIKVPGHPIGRGKIRLQIDSCFLFCSIVILLMITISMLYFINFSSRICWAYDETLAHDDQRYHYIQHAFGKAKRWYTILIYMLTRYKPHAYCNCICMMPKVHDFHKHYINYMFPSSDNRSFTEYTGKRSDEWRRFTWV